ncbi:hypothetical protein DL98DRAFT_650725 [Cadophora sp. DSE1049]|nr:hypothetical protein DL98DRAFT_650725 [Cadophora sp. DSE1049]
MALAMVWKIVARSRSLFRLFASHTKEETFVFEAKYRGKGLMNKEKPGRSGLPGPAGPKQRVVVASTRTSEAVCVTEGAFGRHLRRPILDKSIKRHLLPSTRRPGSPLTNPSNDAKVTGIRAIYPGTRIYNTRLLSTAREMSFAASPVTFGVEIEFNLAYLKIGSDTPLHGPRKTPRLFFPLTKEDLSTFSQQYISKNSRSFQGRSGMWNILELLRSAGHPTDSAIRAEAGPDIVRPREDSEYEWQSVEVKSPALIFSSASLQHISDVCRLITDTYLVETPPSAGLHVHVSAGAGPFNFEIMRALFIFLWTFESQLLSLHPPERQRNIYCQEFRQASRLARGFYVLHSRLPTIYEGIELLLDCEDTTTLLNLARAEGSHKHMAYNPINVLEFEDRYCSLPTIEFRQHEGTVDGERIMHWISTIVGIISRLEQIAPSELQELVLSQVEREFWRDVQGIAVNSASQRNLGSIPVQRPFTAIGLLKWLDLDDQATYYRDRLFPVTSTQAITTATETTETTGGNDESHLAGEESVESMKKVLDDANQRLRDRWADALNHIEKSD